MIARGYLYPHVILAKAGIQKHHAAFLDSRLRGSDDDT
jgi:hypothetical protein